MEFQWSLFLVFKISAEEKDLQNSEQLEDKKAMIDQNLSKHV